MGSPSHSPCHQGGRRPAAKSPHCFHTLTVRARDHGSVFHAAFLAHHRAPWDAPVRAGDSEDTSHEAPLGQASRLDRWGPSPHEAPHCPAEQ